MPPCGCIENMALVPHRLVPFIFIQFHDSVKANLLDLSRD